MQDLYKRLAEANAAAALLSNPERIVALAAETLSAACPHGVALAFMRRPNGSIGSAAAMVERKPVGRDALQHRGPVPYSIDPDNVPYRYRNQWIEPIQTGLHGPEFFSSTNPITGFVSDLIGSRARPDYARMLLCETRRSFAWLGVYVDRAHGFAEAERRELAIAAQQLAAPLRVAAMLDGATLRPPLSRRQEEILARVELGLSNKQIARDLDISPATVKTVLERLFRASGSSNRAALVAWRRGRR